MILIRTIFLIFFSTVFCIDTIKHVKNITSLLTTTDIKSSNDNELLISTIGGVYRYNTYNSSFINVTSKLEFTNINGIEIENSNIWLLGEDANLQILNENYELLNTTTYNAFEDIVKILFYENYIFAIVSNENGDYLAQLENNNTASYLNKYNSFIINNSYESILDLNDIMIKNGMLYLATDIGLIKADLSNLNNNSLSVTLNWSFESYEETLFINEASSGELFFINRIGNQFCNSNSEICLTSGPSNLVSSINFDNHNYLLFNDKIYKENLEEYFVLFEIPDDIKSNFLNIFIYDGMFYFCLENHGVLRFNPAMDSYEYIIPETTLSNSVESIDVNEDGLLAALVDNGIGGFVIDDVLYDESIRNFYSESGNYFDLDNDLFYETYLFSYPVSSNYHDLSLSYNGKILPYISGNISGDIKLNKDGNIYFSNNGIYLQADIFHENIYNPYKDNIEYLSGLLYLDSKSLSILDGWDTEFSGIMDIYPPYDSHNYTSINHMFFDLNQNLFILNPYSERKTPIMIKNNSDEFVPVYDNVPSWYLLPQESILDFNGNLWVSYQKDDDSNLSPGGIRMVQLNQLENSSDDIWYNDPLEIVEEGGCYSGLNSSNLNISLEDNQGEPVSVWSLDIGTDIYGNTLLWTISDYGVMAYVITQYNYSQYFGYLESIEITPISCDFYFTNLSFNKNSKIRVDNQNNAWITSEQGIRIIKSNGEVFSDDYIVSSLNDYLLSNIVNDIVFDENGYVYIAMDKGISIFQSTYSIDKNIDKISVSPNPFVTGEDISITITNLPAMSTVHIMDLSGRVLKEFILDSNTVINWDGKSDEGQFLSTGIYLVSGMASNNKSGVTKLAIIRK